MEVSILNNDSITTIKLIFTDSEKDQLNIESEIDLITTDNITIEDSNKLKNSILETLNSFKISTK